MVDSLERFTPGNGLVAMRAMVHNRNTYHGLAVRARRTLHQSNGGSKQTLDIKRWLPIQREAP